MGLGKTSGSGACPSFHLRFLPVLPDHADIWPCARQSRVAVGFRQIYLRSWICYYDILLAGPAFSVECALQCPKKSEARARRQTSHTGRAGQVFRNYKSKG
jgi:hypothetical protein